MPAMTPLDLSAFDLNEASRRLLAQQTTLNALHEQPDPKAVIEELAGGVSRSDIVLGGFALRTRLLFAVGPVIEGQLPGALVKKPVRALCITLAADANWDGPLNRRTPDASPASLKGAFMTWYIDLAEVSTVDTVMGLLATGHRWSPSLQEALAVGPNPSNPDPEALAWVRTHAAENTLNLEVLATHASVFLGADARATQRLAADVADSTAHVSIEEASSCEEPSVRRRRARP